MSTRNIPQYRKLIKILLFKFNNCFYNLFAIPYGISIFFSPMKITNYCIDMYEKEHVVNNNCGNWNKKIWAEIAEFRQVTYLQLQNHHLIWTITDSHINALWQWIFAVHTSILLKVNQHFQKWILLRPSLVNLVFLSQIHHFNRIWKWHLVCKNALRSSW